MGVAASLNSAMLGAPNRPDDVRLLNNPHGPGAQAAKDEQLHDTFTQFVGQTFYGQMIKSMRSTVGKAAYFNGGQGEKIFQGQLDQTMAEQMTKASADQVCRAAVSSAVSEHRSAIGNECGQGANLWPRQPRSTIATLDLTDNKRFSPSAAAF